MHVMCSTTKEEKVKEVSKSLDEVDDLVEVADRSFATIVENKDTTYGTVPIPLQLVSIVNPMIMLLKNVLFYKISGRKRDHRWETRMSS